ncbi:MAG: D-alanine--D-alanine ligase A, partial [Anaerolineae bacterium]|nr:D-alanine--D-alanine ligase A [Anaerolineae bacterium]
MKEPKRIAVLYGGVSGEHEVSVRSAQSVMRALQEAGYDVLPVYIGKDGAWRLDGGRQLSPGAALPMLSGAEGAASGGRPLLPGGSDSAASASTSDSAADLVFPVLHGTLGEDGALQGLLEVAEMPYVGSGVLGSAVGMDKIAQKLLLRASGLPVVDFATT